GAVAADLPLDADRSAAFSAADDFQIDVVSDVPAARDGQAGGLAAEGQAVQPSQFAQIADDVEAAAARQRRDRRGELRSLERGQLGGGPAEQHLRQDLVLGQGGGGGELDLRGCCGARDLDDGGEGRVFADRFEVEADSRRVGGQGDRAAVIKDETLACELIIAAHHIGRAAQLRIGDGAANARIGGQFDIQPAPAHVDFTTREVQVQADPGAAPRLLLGLHGVAAGAVDLDHIHFDDAVRAGQVRRDFSVVDVQIAGQLDIAVSATHSGQAAVGAGLGDVVVDDAETRQFQPQG